MSEEAPKRTSSIVLVVLVLLIFFVFAGMIIYASRSTGSTVACSLEASLESLKNGQMSGTGVLQTKGRLMGGGSYGLSCPTQFRFITSKVLAEKKRSTQELVATLKQPKENYAQVHASQLVVKELTDCYTKMGPRGMFDPFNKIDSTTLNTYTKKSEGFWTDLVDTFKKRYDRFTGSTPVLAPPVYCAVCSQIRFSSDAQSELLKKGSSKMTLVPVLQNTVFSSQDKQSAYDVLQSIRPLWATEDSSYTLDITQPSAVVFFKRYDYKTTLSSFFLKNLQDEAKLILIQYNFASTLFSGAVHSLLGSSNNRLSHLTRFPGANQQMQSTTLDNLKALTIGQSDLSDYLFGPIEGFAVVSYEDMTQFCDYVANSYSTNP
jgi:hypothetical protein